MEIICVEISGIDCCTVSETVTEPLSYIYFLNADTSESMSRLLAEELFAIRKRINEVLEIDRMIAALTVAPVRTGKTRERMASFSLDDFDWTLDKSLEEKWMRHAYDAYKREMQAELLRMDLGRVTSALSYVQKKEWKPFISRKSQRHEEMTQELDAFERAWRAWYVLERRPFGFGMAASGTAEQDDLMAAEQSSAEQWLRLLKQFVDRLAEMHGASTLQRHGTMVCNERICRNTDVIKVCICDHSQRLISRNRISKLFAFSPKLRITAGNEQIPAMLAA